MMSLPVLLSGPMFLCGVGGVDCVWGMGVFLQGGLPPDGEWVSLRSGVLHYPPLLVLTSSGGHQSG